MPKVRPHVEFLDQDLVRAIVAEAYLVLEEVGMLIDNREALELLEAHGASVDFAKQIARFPAGLIDRTRATVPASVRLYSRDGELRVDMCGRNVYFAPGSAAIYYLDHRTEEVRKPTTADYVLLSKVVEHLKYMDAHSTCLVCADVPETVADRYRVYLALRHCSKPLVTGTFSVDGFGVIKDMLAVVAGGEKALREKPRAILDCCPSSPLKWSDVTSQNLIDCARFGIPAELISMPLSGAIAPVTLTGSLVQHTAESLSGVVIHQLAGPGSPLIYGGSPAIFDMRKGTTPMGAIETMMIDSAYNEIGKHLGFPTHGYMGLSDAKRVNCQAGFETGMGAMLAALSGVNMVSGPGMLDFESCQSLEKLVIDNEICGMAQRMVRGIERRDETMALGLLRDIHEKEHLLTSPHTLRWLREEHFMPSEVVDRATRSQDLKEASTMRERASREIERLAALGSPRLDEGREKELRKIMAAEEKRCGFCLPEE